MNEWQKQQQGKTFEGWAFTFCKAAFLVLILGKYALLGLSGLATAFYLLASWRGVKEWRCWAKPPWVTAFWAFIFGLEVWRVWVGEPLVVTVLRLAGLPNPFRG